jgi:hypothetical protein
VPPALLWVATLANAYHRPLFARHVRMTIALDSGVPPAPIPVDLSAAAELLPDAATTWAELLRTSAGTPDHTPTAVTPEKESS